MSVVSTFTIRDRYTSTAKKIEQSAFGMARALEAGAGAAKKTGGALKSAFDRSYEVKVNKLNLSQHRKSVMQMEGALTKATGRPYEVKITAKRGFREQASRNLNAIKKQAQSTASAMSSSFSRIKVNTSALLKARKDARSLQKELRQATGRRHRVRIGVRGEDSALDRIKAKIKTLTGRDHTVVVGVDDSGGGGGGGRGGRGVMGAIAGGGKTLLRTGGMAVAGAGALVLGGVVGGGSKRWADQDTAKAKMRGLGHDQASVDVIMDNVNEAVTGTQFGRGEGAMVAAGAVGAGIKPGEELETMLTTVANSAAAAGVDLDEMGAIFNKAATSGKAHNDVLGQVADRGIPIYSKLAEVMGVSQEAIFDMASKGEIGFEQFQEAMALASGNVAEEMAKTVPGASANLRAAFSRIGEALMGGALENLVPALLVATDFLKGLVPAAAKLGTKIGNITAGAFTWLQENSEQIGSVFQEIGSVVGPVLKGAFQVIGTIVTSIVIPALKVLGGIVRDVVWPIFKALAGVISDYVLPFLNKLAGVVASVVMPVFERIANIVGGVVTTAFNVVTRAIDLAKRAFDGIKSVVDNAKRSFNRVKDAVDSAVEGLGGIGKRIGDALNNLNPFSRVGRNASGTTYHRGGVTRINELGGEAWKLPEGTKIYPSGKTTDMIKKEVIKPGPSRNESKVVTLAPVFHIYGGDAKNGKKIGGEVERRLRRLVVTI